MRTLGIQRRGDIVDTYYQHLGADNRKKITIQSVQDVEPIMEQVKVEAQNQMKGFRLKAKLPAVVIDEACKVCAKVWNISVKDAFSEILTQKTDRAKHALKVLTEGRDFRKLQARHYA